RRLVWIDFHDSPGEILKRTHLDAHHLTCRIREPRFHSSSVNVTFSTSRKFNSTGVERPKIVTVTFRVDLSSLTSSTLPVKLWNGPDLMRTVSPAAYENLGLGFSAAAAC